MADNAGQAPTTPAADAPETPASNVVRSQDAEPQVFDATYVHQLRAEAAANRKRATEAETRLKALEDAQLTEQERLTKRVTELEPLAGSVRDYEAAMSEMLTARLAGMTPEAKKAVESLPAQDPLSRLRWLTANEALFTRQAAPKLDGGAGGGERQNAAPALTAEEEAMARKMGVSLEKYAARKAERLAESKAKGS
jgi:hypothetical protein